MSSSVFVRTYWIYFDRSRCWLLLRFIAWITRKLVCFLLLVVQLYLDRFDLFSPCHVMPWYFWQAVFTSYPVLKFSPTVDLAACL